MTSTQHGAFYLGSDLAYLAKAKDVQPHIDMVNESADCLFKGDVDALITEYKGQEFKWNFEAGMKNKVRKCPKCNKPNAFTLDTCNSCATDISKTEISYTNNIFTSFCFGVQKGPFPFKISMRMQTKDYLVFDDLLALSSCHMNAIPTSHYIPDFRYLLATKEGVGIATTLRNNMIQVFKDQFWSNAQWKKKNIRNSDEMKLEEMATHLITGFNYPPSQYQLHLQFFAPPLTPFHYQAYLNGVHFTKGRFIPFEYLTLIAALDVPFIAKDSTSIEEIFEFYKKRGVDYDDVWQKCYDRYGESHRALANWDYRDFEAVVVGGKGYAVDADGTPGDCLDVDVSALINDDKMVLQNYGRPYADGRPTGTYYKHAKTPVDMKGSL